MIGYETVVDSAVQVDAGERTALDIVLEVSPITLAEMVVTPGRFAIMNGDPVVRQTLSKEDVNSIPQLGDDSFRAITRVPGVSSNDFSARFTVRGGEHEEVLVLVDGLEVSQAGYGGKFSWWASYALARVEERIAGVDVPKNQDQRHTVYIDLNYRTNRKWRVGLAWQYHSGWPYSERIFLPAAKPPGEFPFEQIFGSRNAARLPACHRMDLRGNRQFKLGGGRGSIFLDSFNLYDRGNVQARFPRARWRGPGFPVEFDGTFDEEWVSLLLSIGARWEI